MPHRAVSGQGAAPHPRLHPPQVPHLHLLPGLQEVEDTKSRLKALELCVTQTRGFWDLYSINRIPGSAYQKSVNERINPELLELALDRNSFYQIWY